jgi:acyl-CoA synthetase (NDP forming)/GNAT superfamily N-acetyltransferase
MSEDAAYDVVLRDGSTARIRSAGSDDAAAVRDFLAALSERARWFRFFSGSVDLESAARDAVAPADGRALLVLTGSPEHVVGHAMWVRAGSDEAEVAFAVDGAWEGRGLATTLLAHLADDAAERGIHVFTAITLPGNHRMIGVFRDSGFPVEVASQPGELHVRLPTSLTEEGRRRFEARERDAAVAAVSHVLRPATVIVLAASARPGTVGGELLDNLRAFAGTLYVLAPGAEPAELPESVDLALVALPRSDVPAATRGLSERADVRALVVLAAEGGELHASDELLATCRAAGMRLVGPNSLGVATTDPAIGLNATYAPTLPPRGRIGFGTQSSSSGIAALDQAAAHGLGLSSFVSMGAKADLSGNDMLQFWEQDDATDVVLLHLESFGNPRRFGHIARRVAAAKPVIAVKSGRRAGRPRAGSQTGALVTAADTSVDALFRHAGVIRTDTLAEMFDLAALLTGQPSPHGDRVAIVTNSGGLGVQCADACDAAGLALATLDTRVQRALITELPLGSTVEGTIDVTAEASGTDYGRAVAAAVADPAVDAVIALFARPLGTRAEDVAEALEQAAARSDVPVLGVFVGAMDLGRSTAVPRFAAPEEAVRALAHAVADARRRAEPPDPPPVLSGVDADRAAAIVADGLAAGGGWLPREQVEALLSCYGVPVAESRLVKSARAAARTASELGGSVAVKAIAPELVRKSAVGGVRLELRGPAAVERGAHDVLSAAESAGHVPDGVLVQRMAEPGTELLIGVTGDPRFGPLVAIAAGGAMAELFGDVQVRLAPVGRREGATMLRGLRTFPLLEGFGGRPAADLAAVEDAVLRVGALAAAHPEVAELDCDPVVAGPAGALVVDARVRLEPPPPRAPYAVVERF